MASPEDYIIRFTDPARADGELSGSTFIIKPFTANGPQHPSIDVNFTDPETGNATSRQGPLVLFGKGIPEYGEQWANNLLQVTENFAGASPPRITGAGGQPLPGVTWFQDERYWVDTLGGDIFVWDDSADQWDDVNTLSTTNSITFGLAADRSISVPLPVTGDYYYATDTQQLSMFYVWSDYTPTIQAWLNRISRPETFSPTTERPRRTLSVYDPTDTVEGFVRLLNYKGNDAGDPITGELHITGNAYAAAPTISSHLTTKLYVDNEIASAIGGNNQLHQLLDVDPLTDATIGSGIPPSNGQILIFDTSLNDANVDGKWTHHTLVAADMSDFSSAADARIAAAALTDIGDVDVTNGPAIDGYALTYNDSSGNWEAVSPSDTFVLGDGEIGGGPYTANDVSNEVVLLRNDVVSITLDNIATQNNYSDHVTGVDDRHDSADIDYTGPALGVGTPTDVEAAIILLDAGITASSGGYLSLLGVGANASGGASPGGAELPANQLQFSSGNNRLTIAISDDSPADVILFTVNEANIDHDNLTNYVADEHIDHSAVSVHAGADSGLTATNNDLTANIGLSVDIAGTTTEAIVDGSVDLFLMWDDSASALRAVLGDDLPGGGGGLSNAYTSLSTSGANASGSASSSGASAIQFRSANNGLTIAIADGPPDDILFTFNEANITITESQISDLGTYLENVVEDTTPQLGGDLDVNGNDIVSVSNGDINILPDGSGTIQLDSMNLSNVTGVQTTDATVTTLQTITLASDTERMVVARVRGHETATDESLWSFIRFGVKNVGGTASLIGSISQDSGQDDVTWGGVTVDVTGATARIRVTGEATSTIDWVTTTEVS